MARYVATIKSSMSAEDAFLYMADLRNFEEWDPSVKSSKLISGEAPGPTAVYETTVNKAVLEYHTSDYDEPNRVVATAKTNLLYSYDVIEVTPTDTGCTVMYDATFELNGLLGTVANPFVKLFFNKLGDNAAAGMEKALDGEKIS